MDVNASFPREVLVGRLGKERVHKGLNPTTDVFLLGLKWLEETDPGHGWLQESTLDHVDERVLDDCQGEERGKDNPVELAEEAQLWPTLGDQAAIGEPDENHPEEEVEGEGGEVDVNDGPAGDLENVAPENAVRLKGHRH